MPLESDSSIQARMRLRSTVDCCARAVNGHDTAALPTRDNELAPPHGSIPGGDPTEMITAHHAGVLTVTEFPLPERLIRRLHPGAKTAWLDRTYRRHHETDAFDPKLTSRRQLQDGARDHEHECYILGMLVLSCRFPRPESQTAKSQIAETACRRGGPYV